MSVMWEPSLLFDNDFLCLCNRIGHRHPDNQEMVSQEVFKAFETRAAGWQSMKRLAEAVLRMAGALRPSFMLVQKE